MSIHKNEYLLLKNQKDISRTSTKLLSAARREWKSKIIIQKQQRNIARISSK